MPMNRDEKGRISPAQSRIARSMGDIARSQGGSGPGSAKRRYGEYHSGVAGMHRMMQLKEANPHKAAKTRKILKAGKDAYRKNWIKGYSQVKKGRG